MPELSKTYNMNKGDPLGYILNPICDTLLCTAFTIWCMNTISTVLSTPVAQIPQQLVGIARNSHICCICDKTLENLVLRWPMEILTN